MTKRPVPLIALAVLAGSISAAAAEPCAPMIADTQSALDRIIADRAGNGPAAPESEGALLGHEPTPEGIARVEGEIGDGVEPDRALAALERARKAEAAGDMERCQKELADARDAIGLQ